MLNRRDTFCSSRGLASAPFDFVTFCNVASFSHSFSIWLADVTDRILSPESSNPPKCFRPHLFLLRFRRLNLSKHVHQNLGVLIWIHILSKSVHCHFINVHVKLDIILIKYYKIPFQRKYHFWSKKSSNCLNLILE